MKRSEALAFIRKELMGREVSYYFENDVLDVVEKLGIIKSEWDSEEDPMQILTDEAQKLKLGYETDEDPDDDNYCGAV